MGDHWHLSGIFLKPLRAWDYPNNLPFVPKRRCLPVVSTVFKIDYLESKKADYLLIIQWRLLTMLFPKSQ